MGYGREWNLPPLEPNEVYIDFRVAASLGISVNDTIYVRIPGWSFYEVLLLPDGMDIWYTARVAEVISSPMGKSAYTDIDPLIFAEYKHFLASLTDQLESVFAVSYLRDYDLYEYAQRVSQQFPPF